MGNLLSSRPVIRPFNTEDPFEIYAVGLKRGGKFFLVDAIYDSENLAAIHRSGLKSLPQYKDVKIKIKKMSQVTTLEQIRAEFGLDSTEAIAQIVGHPPHAWSSIGPMF